MQTAPVNLLDYANYLQLNKLLDAQSPKSDFHDEMLFILVHQVYELWFKQILCEVDAVKDALSKKVLSDTAIFQVVKRLERIIKIQQLMIDQIKILETMTPMDFLEFRDLLGTSSGLESYQFRLLEVKLGIHYDMTSPQIARLSLPYQQLIAQALSSPSLLSLVDQWLSRTPFLHIDDFTFWTEYQNKINTMHEQEKLKIHSSHVLTDQEKLISLQQLQQTEQHFKVLFDEALYAEKMQAGERKLSRRALQAALLIYVYRSQPAFHLPYMLLTALVEIDNLLSSWRYAHMLMVQRMIGQRIGTGGTSGQQYLMQAMQSRKIFTDINNLASFLIPGSQLPLPDKIKQQLGLTYAL